MVVIAMIIILYSMHANKPISSLFANLRGFVIGGLHGYYALELCILLLRIFRCKTRKDFYF